ncbi:hypothetical protein BCR32DRAFT_294951 [Anaeromyces robustus]|uniref:YEATS domain-containing protein n=1 Tax=Anaeromyces robustus TaxID=1754192 RepID=A0A1Y1WYJ5_9FUNG|nr:hypothetical protein BCR32DRAFT_294951 [Anaeromyces robustus]|eukprot:ORX78620.1 hypothetical protein BCR32DRAFT_294951 [Anaeromyces robustus]
MNSFHFNMKDSENKKMATPVRKIKRDAATINKVSEILKTQFDVEIYLKRHEIWAIENEIEKGETLLQNLRDTLINGKYIPKDEPIVKDENIDNESNTSKSKTTSKKVSSYKNSVNSTRPSRSSSISKDNSYITQVDILYGKRDDGKFVRIQCPKCFRCNFSNLQGFLNHCRISHKMEFPSHEEATRRCGIVVDESEVPINHPCRKKTGRSVISLRDVFIETSRKTKLINMNSQLSKFKERPKIKEFDEDVDMDSDTSSVSSSTISTVPSQNNRIQKSTLRYNTSQLSKSILYESDNDSTTSASSIKKKKKQNNNNNNDNNNNNNNNNNDNNDNNDNDNDYNDYLKLLQSKYLDNEIENVSPLNPNPKILATPHKPLNEGSRFYMTKRIVIGNVSQYIPPEKREKSMEKYMYKWMIYTRGVLSEPISTFIKKVRYFLHPSYKPNIIDVTYPPFHLTRYGWGEFPIRVQLFFEDIVNKPIDIIHILKLDTNKTGNQVLGNEKTYDIEIDRNTKFVEPKKERIPNHKRHNSVSLTKEMNKMNLHRNSSNQSLSGPIEKIKSNKEKINSRNIRQDSPVLGTRPRRSSNNNSSSLPKDTFIDVENDDSIIPPKTINKPIEYLFDDKWKKALKNIIHKYPIIQNVYMRNHYITYSTAKNEQMFWKWPIGKRRSVEWQRARILLQQLRQNSKQNLPSNVTIRNILKWCRQEGYTPTIYNYKSQVDLSSHLTHPSEDSIFNSTSFSNITTTATTTNNNNNKNHIRNNYSSTSTSSYYNSSASYNNRINRTNSKFSNNDISHSKLSRSNRSRQSSERSYVEIENIEDDNEFIMEKVKEEEEEEKEKEREREREREKEKEKEIIEEEKENLYCKYCGEIHNKNNKNHKNKRNQLQTYTCTNNKTIIHSTVTPIQLLLSKLNKGHNNNNNNRFHSRIPNRSRHYNELKKIISTFCYSEMEDYSLLSSILNLNNTSFDIYSSSSSSSLSSSSSSSSFSSLSSSDSSSSYKDSYQQRQQQQQHINTKKDNFRYFIPYDILEIYSFIKKSSKDIHINLPSNSKDNKEIQLIFAMALQIFIKKLLKQGLKSYEYETKALFDPSHKKSKKQIKFLTPYHIYKAIQHHPKFDFLLNKYLGDA